MIKVNGTEINVEHFLAGEQRIKNLSFAPIYPSEYDFKGDFNIAWLYDNDEELTTLWYIVNHIRENYLVNTMTLTMPYVPNARMDRVYNNTEIFTEKHFAKLINLMGFDKVYSLDVHSNVTLGNIERIEAGTSIVESNIWNVINMFAPNIVIYFPDNGALTRYGNMENLKRFPKIFGKKKRDKDNGKIIGLTIHNEDESPIESLAGKTVLMIDDIISYGGTLAYSADELKKYGAEHIYAYASHTENSVLDEENGTLIKRLQNRTVDVIFTTNSIYRGNSPYIAVIYEF